MFDTQRSTHSTRAPREQTCNLSKSFGSVPITFTQRRATAITARCHMLFHGKPTPFEVFRKLEIKTYIATNKRTKTSVTREKRCDISVTSVCGRHLRRLTLVQGLRLDAPLVQFRVQFCILEAQFPCRFLVDMSATLGRLLLHYHQQYKLSEIPRASLHWQ